MANVSKLLYTTVDPETYLVNLTPRDRFLREAKKTIRDHLRKAFAAGSEQAFGRMVRPRFFTQGSFAYKTLNDPAWPPHQQMDLDDGCYLPLSFVQGTRPSQAATMFFEFVDTALKDMAEEMGWDHVEKPTCSRLVISSDAHIDVPLYAIPDAQFQLLEVHDALSTRTAIKKSLDDWSDLPSDAVLLAHRDEDWVESDPRLIHRWFTDAVRLYGERLRRDARFIKGWRDHFELDQYRVTSILLMACIWQAYEEIRGLYLPEREDERLLAVAERLSGYLRTAVPNPACKSEDLNRIAGHHREMVARKMEKLASQLEEIVKRCDNEAEAVAQMRAAFGLRVPNRPDLVSIPATLAGKITAQSKKAVPAPEVGRSVSG
ncbi:CBASS cGAMP synthase [Mesorhizobium sp. YIM 152430]|nr:CBASS cGAMP synthase [Mesorhizobium sp. YIM 152430]